MLRELLYKAVGTEYDEESEESEPSADEVSDGSEDNNNNAVSTTARSSREIQGIPSDSDIELGPLGDDDAKALENKALAEKAVVTAFKEEEAEPINGNIYRYLAFMTFGKRKINVESMGEKSLLEPPPKAFNFCIMHAGIVFVGLIQVIAPAAIFITSLDDLISAFDLDAWRHYDWNQWLIVMLAWAFLFLFILSTYFQITQEVEASRRCCRLARGLRHLGQPVCECMLILDAIINGYVAVVVSMVMFVVLYQERRAIDVLLDSLSLAFLNNIDDIASDLGFLGGVWDDQRVGDFYAALGEEGVYRDCNDPDPDDKEGVAKADNMMKQLTRDFPGADDDLMSGIHKAEHMADDCLGSIPHCIYICTRGWLVLLLMVAVPSPFIFASSAKAADPNALDPNALQAQIKAEAAEAKAESSGHGPARGHGHGGGGFR
mmetsp:Transcript_24654/g.57246  ORF Transcript_24654/g.57246 Transcript_24654/m.57246 type:complete len:433 (+) Transcript_24654:127-1425(+)